MRFLVEGFSPCTPARLDKRTDAQEACELPAHSMRESEWKPACAFEGGCETPATLHSSLARALCVCFGVVCLLSHRQNRTPMLQQFFGHL